jgi:hypothetical protein
LDRGVPRHTQNRRAAARSRACGYGIATGHPVWLNRDPIFEAGGINVYTFTLNAPILYLDTDGRGVETLVDAGSICASAWDLFTEPSWGNAGYLEWDVAATAIPGVPGSWVVKTSKLAKLAGKSDGLPKRVTNPKHHPGSKSPEPANVDDLYNRSIVDDNGVRWAKDDDGVVHRFSKPSNGECHWNGSTGGGDPILMQNIPNEVLQKLRSP